MRSHILIAVTMISLLGGCAQKPEPATQAQLTNVMEQQKAQIAQLLNQRCAEEFQLDAAEQAYQTQVIEQLTGVNTAMAALVASSQRPPVECPEVKPDPLGEKMVLGEVEHVYVQEVGRAFDARVDTGAVSSSISAQNIQAFERDGKEWVRFEIPRNGEPQADEKDEKTPEANTVEARIARYVNIKRASAEGTERRPVILARLKVGDYVAETELNLTDRSHMEYPLLLGRKFFKDIAVVDVSRSYILSDSNSQ
ncbi:ATP-dependent zinc protease [Ferrimonas gelatinilytica]|uniref:ATP-dependent zinc protease n=1 Tax=Ferrimonas gelatinilytica TaxID=1255257 RepID=A0ABP9RX95_9GAMM